MAMSQRYVQASGYLPQTSCLTGAAAQGKPLDVEGMRYLVRAASQPPWWLSKSVGNVGIAGGLWAETLPAVADLVRDGCSTDAEGKLRDDADGGGNLDLAKVRDHLRTHGEILVVQC